MVSLNTILAIGGLAIAFITFTRLGGASGIGARLGGGFSSFAESFTGGLGGLFGGDISPSKASDERDPTQAPMELTGKPPALGIPTLQGNFQGTANILQSLTNAFGNLTSGAFANPLAFRVTPSFTQSAIEQRIAGTSKITFEGVAGFRQAGFSNAEKQEIALQDAIIASQLRNPSFFLTG